MSNREDDMGLARERLLDASLAELLRGRRVLERTASPARSRWLFAAVALLGMGVVTATAWWNAARPSHEAGGERDVQDPAPIPKPKACTSAEAMLAMDVDVPSLLLVLEDPADLAHVERFRSLRELIVLSPREGSAKTWGELDRQPRALAAIGSLPTLERLQLPQHMKVTADHLRSLAGARRLRSLSVPQGMAANVETAAALTGLPGLRELRITKATLQAGFLAALAPRSLTRLELDACRFVEPSILRELVQLPSVRHLAVRYLTGFSEKTPEIGEVAFDTFEQMAGLVDLDLDETNFEDRFMRRLPMSLTRLRLGYHVMTPSTIADLKRLANLKELIFHHATHYDAVVDLLGALRLEKVFLHGWLDDRVLEAIAGHPSIESVTLRLRGRVELTPLRHAKKLKDLDIRFDRNVPAAGDPPEELLQALRRNGVEVSFDRDR